MTAPDPQTVREVAQEIILKQAKYWNAAEIRQDYRTDPRCVRLSDEDFTDVRDAVINAIVDATVTVSWPHEQPTAEQGAPDRAAVEAAAAQHGRDRVVQAAARELTKLTDAWLGWFDGGQDGEPPSMPERRIEIADHLGRVRIVLTQLKRLEREREAVQQCPACPVCGRTDVPLTGAGQMEYHFDNRPNGSGWPSCKGVGAPARTADLAARDEREAPRCDHGPDYQCVNCIPDDGSFSFEPLGGER